MSYRNFIIENIYSLFKNELDERLNIELTMDSSRNNNEVMNADVIYSDSVVVDPDGKILSLKIKNTSGNSFLSLDKRLDGKKVLINNSEWGTIVEHQINNFDYKYDYFIVQGNFLTIKKTYKTSIRSLILPLYGLSLIPFLNFFIPFFALAALTHLFFTIKQGD